MATSGWFGTRKIHELFTFLALGLFGVMTWKLLNPEFLGSTQRFSNRAYDDRSALF